jgi:Flp pilus assembly protein TadD
MTILQTSTSGLEQLLSEAKAFEEKRDYTAAQTKFNEILKQFPNNPTAYYEVGTFYNHIGQYERAKNILANALKQQPDNANAWLSLGVSLQSLKSDSESEKCYRQAIALNANLAAAYCNLGIIYRNKGLFHEAIQFYQRALAIDPNLAIVYSALSNALLMIGETEQAITMQKKAIELSPGQAKAYNGLGMIMQLTQHFDEALMWYQKALSIAPTYSEAQFNLGLYYLQQGDFKQGLPRYEARWQLLTANPIRSQFIYPRWNGESLQGKSLLIFTEQGYGDIINFCRYIPLINKANGKIYLNCQLEMVSLMKTLSCIDRIIPRGDENPAVDYYIPLQSLPLVFETTLETIPANVPYLTTDQEKVAYWRDFFEAQPAKLKVGICWRGRPNLVNTINRTCGLYYFEPLFSIPNIAFFSLQKELLPEEEGRLSNIICLGDKLNDFTDTAAIIEQLDLVITIDTSIAHLAGALNKPVWNLLPYTPDWRWFLNRRDSPWYPSMHLYRQSAPNDWKSIFTQVMQDLGTIYNSLG